MIRRFWRDLVDSTEVVATRRALREARKTSIASAAEGTFVRFAGTCAALDATVVTAPFSERPCIAYTVAIDSVAGLVVRRIGVPFVLDVGGERVIVDPKGARYALSRAVLSETRGFGDPTPAQRALLDEVVGGDIQRPEGISYTEATIAVGDELVIGGFVVREVDRENRREVGPYRETPTRLRLFGTPAQPLLIANDRGLVD